MNNDGETQIASIFGGKFFKSTNYGNNWKELKNIPSLFWKCISISSKGNLSVAVAKNENIIYSYDMWNTYNTYPLKKNWTSVSVSGNGHIILACEYGGKLYVGINNNTSITFNEVSGRLFNNWMSCCVSGTGKYQSAVSDYIYVSNDYGANWSIKSEKNNWFGISMSFNGKYQSAIDISGRVHISDTYGEKWKKVKEITSIPFSNISVSGDGKYQSLYATGGKIFTSKDYGNTWESVFQSKQWFGISTSDNGKYQTACEYSGYLYTSKDYGKTWLFNIDTNQQNWSSVCMTRGNKNFEDDNSNNINIINIKPEYIPAQNIIMPIIPGYDTVAIENQIYTPPKPVAPPPLPPPPPSPTGATGSTGPSGPTGSTGPTGTSQKSNGQLPSSSNDTIYITVIVLLILIILTGGGYYLYKKIKKQ